MKYAIDRTTGETVMAGKVAAQGRRYRRFRCPVCNKPVYLRAGSRRIPHFAHSPGEAKPDCENYHPSDSSGGDGVRRTQVRAVTPHALYIVVDPALGGPPRWRLEILVPAAPGKGGSVKVNDSPHGEVVLECTRLVGGGRRVEVLPKGNPYRLIPQHIDNSGYEALLRIPTPGLALNHGTPFRLASQASRRLSDSNSLHWGRSYVVIWAEQLNPSWPTDIRRDDLCRRPGWNAAVIGLPATPSSETETWAEDFLRKPVEYPSPEMRVISPPILSVSDEGWIQVQEGEEVVLAVTGARGRAQDYTFTVISPSGERHTIPLPTSDLSLLTLDHLQPGRTEVFLDHRDMDEIVLQTLEDPSWASADAKLVFRDAQLEQLEVALSLFSQAAESHLKRARQGEVEVVDVVSPPGGRCIVRSTVNPYEPSRERIFVESRYDDGPTILGSAEPMEQLVSYLCQMLGNADVEIDFGNFGHLLIRSRDLMTDRPRLPAELREQILWLLTIPGAEVPIQLSPFTLLARISSAARDPEQNTILKQFFARERWPTALLPHLMAMDKSLTRMLKREER